MYCISSLFKISDLKEEALSYKKQLTDATDELKGFKNISLDDFDDVSYDDDISEESPMAHVAKKENPKEDEKVAPVTTQVEAKNETVTFEKPKKKTKTKVATKDVPKKNAPKKDKSKDNTKGDA